MIKEKMNDILKNPEIFEINRIKPHSDHYYYSNDEFNTSYKKSLNGKWMFKFAEKLDERIDDFYSMKNYDEFDSINVPGHIELQGYGKCQYVNTQYPWDGNEKLIPPNFPVENNQIGQYIKKFTIPANWTDMPVLISLDGVEVAFNIWCNGKYVGYSEDSHTPARFDLTEYVVEGENILGVEVYKYASSSWLEDQDCWRFFGIHRDVYLYTYPEAHVKDIFIKTHLINDYKDANISIDYKLTKPSNMKIILKDAEDIVVYEKNVKCEINGNYTFSLSDVCLWSAENPYLYNLELVLDNEIVKQKIGIREFKLINNIMCINGKRIFFRGVNRHDFSTKNGRSVTKEEMMWDVKFLKSHNFNAVRSSHYPNQTYWYELCDEYGLYVIDEANLESHGTWQKMGVVDHDSPHIVPHNKKEWKPAVIDRASNMFERDKNHPSIIIWSCGNESYAGEVISEMANYFRKCDSTRLVHYEGVFNNRTYDDASDMESRMYARVDDIKEYLDNNPKKPFMLCEYSHAMGNSNGGLDEYEKLSYEYELYQGGFIWEYIDHGITVHEDGIEKIKFGGDFDDRPTDYNFVIDGILKSDRTITAKVQELKYIYQTIKVEITKDQIYISNENLFTNTNEYIANLEVFLDGKIESQKPMTFDVEPGNKKSFGYSYDFNREGEYVVRVSFVLKESNNWALKGHEVAFGETAFTNSFRNYYLNEKSEMPLLLIDGDVNIGIKGESFKIQFSKDLCKMTSMNYGGTEFLKNPYFLPSPNFWRAVTDNDRGAGKGFEFNQWKLASLYQKGLSINAYMKDDKVFVNSEIILGSTPNIILNLDYIIHANGRVDFKQTMNSVENMADLFRFGISMKINKDYHIATWYGNGPLETQSDRKKGGKLGIYSRNIDDEINYSYPQNFGNKTDIRWIDITNFAGKGLRITSPLPFECTPGRHCDHELELAYHNEELPSVSYTYLAIDKVQTGVAGDDSWGSWVDEKYMLKSNKKRCFEFSIEPIL